MPKSPQQLTSNQWKNNHKNYILDRENTDTITVTVFFITGGILLGIWAITAPISATVLFGYDINDNVGYAQAYLFGISLIRLPVSFVSFDLASRSVILKIDKRVVAAPLILPAGADIIGYLPLPVLSVIDFVILDMNFVFGVKNNALITVTVAQLVRTAAQITSSIIKNSQTLVATGSFTPLYGEDCLRLNFSGIINASIADIIYSFFRALRKKIKADARKKIKEVS